MRAMRFRPLALLALTALSCSGPERVASDTAPATVAAPAARVTELPAPSGEGAAEPFLSDTRQGILLSWLEPVAGTDRVALRYSRLAGEAWSGARTIVERNDLFVNWADFPSVIEDANGVLFAHWLQKNASGTYTYDVRMATSADGLAWGEHFLLNRDGKKAEHGFATLAPLPGGGIGATWLDGRNMAGMGAEHAGHDMGGDMTLRYAEVAAEGTLTNEVELDGRTCECCTTGMVMVEGSPVIVYRDRSPDEIRDISFVRRAEDGWTSPKSVQDDGWKIEGCPVNGPQIDAIGGQLAAAWFTAAREEGKVWLAFSTDGGASFLKPVQVDDGNPVGRLDILMLDASTALVTWLEQTATGTEIRARRVRAEGAEPSVKIADSSSARAAGFPRIARAGRDVYFAWTEQSADTKKVRLAKAAFGD